jgi:hypothetical protein
MTKRISLLIVAAILIWFNASAQRKKSAILANDGDTGVGSITLSDGTVLYGPVKYNDNIGAVRLEDRDNPRTFKPSQVSAFNFFSEKFERDRDFLSLEFNDANAANIYFFEILKEFKTFAVLTKIDAIKTEVINNSTAYPYTASNRVRATQTETIYFFTDQGKISPYLQIIETETPDNLIDWNTTKNRFLNKSLMEKFTGKYYAQLESFADNNKLSFKSKEHLVKILAYYSELLEK